MFRNNTRQLNNKLKEFWKAKKDNRSNNHL